MPCASYVSRAAFAKICLHRSKWKLTNNPEHDKDLKICDYCAGWPQVFFHETFHEVLLIGAPRHFCQIVRRFDLMVRIFKPNCSCGQEDQKEEMGHAVRRKFNDRTAHSLGDLEIENSKFELKGRNSKCRNFRTHFGGGEGNVDHTEDWNKWRENDTKTAFSQQCPRLQKCCLRSVPKACEVLLTVRVSHKLEEDGAEEGGEMRYKMRSEFVLTNCPGTLVIALSFWFSQVSDEILWSLERKLFFSSEISFRNRTALVL